MVRATLEFLARAFAVRGNISQAGGNCRCKKLARGGMLEKAKVPLFDGHGSLLLKPGEKLWNAAQEYSATGEQWRGVVEMAGVGE